MLLNKAFLAFDYVQTNLQRQTAVLMSSIMFGGIQKRRRQGDTIVFSDDFFFPLSLICEQENKTKKNLTQT